MATTRKTFTKEEIDAELEHVEREHAAWKAKREAKISQIEGIFAMTPAIRGTGYRDEPRMAIKSGELSDLAAGTIRVTFFGPDGPHGHVTKATEHAAAEAVLEFMDEPFSAMAVADVMEWTTTPTFERGSRIIAIVQAENTLRYFAGRAGRSDWAYEIIRARGPMQFDEVPLERLDSELERLVAAIRELPVPNRRVLPLVRNPAWVTGAIADHYELLDDKVPPRWMPQLQHVDHDGDNLLARLTEFGCGVYGCVIATADPDTVLKVTSDETEAEFASTLANELAAPVCVEYRLVIRIATRHKGAQVHLLWREAADHVGKIDTALGGDKGRLAATLIDAQHFAAQRAYAAIFEHREAEIAEHLHEWLDAVRRWERVPELAPLAAGILEVWDAQHVLFGDIHAGNLGYVKGRDAWVITDPGNIAVVSDDRYW